MSVYIVPQVYSKLHSLYLLFLSFADKTVSMAEMRKEDDIVREAFQRLLMPSQQTNEMNIIETPEMDELYKTVVGSDGNMLIFLKGPPGVGKTTSLFWLYQQLKQLESFFTIVIPFQTLLDNFEYVSSRIKQCSSTDKKMVLLMDLLTPTVDCIEQQKKFFQILAKSECANSTVVIAQSSSFVLFCHLKPNEASDWVETSYWATSISLKPYEDDLSKKFLISLLGKNVEEGDIDSMVQYCKGIPKLLAFCRSGMTHCKAPINSVLAHEFHTVLNYMVSCYKAVHWKRELMLLVAARLKMNIDHVGLTKPSAEGLVMCLSYLVDINEKVSPFCTFPGTVMKSSF